jgi:hypothetical protein
VPDRVVPDGILRRIVNPPDAIESIAASVRGLPLCGAACGGLATRQPSLLGLSPCHAPFSDRLRTLPRHKATAPHPRLHTNSLRAQFPDSQTVSAIESITCAPG